MKACPDGKEFNVCIERTAEIKTNGLRLNTWQPLFPASQLNNLSFLIKSGVGLASLKRTLALLVSKCCQYPVPDTESIPSLQRVSLNYLLKLSSTFLISIFNYANKLASN
jgi:hypothetical protein